MGLLQSRNRLIGGTDSDLILAARDGHAAIVERLLAAGADVNGVDENDWNALMLAAREGHTAIVERLLAAGADVNAKDYAGNTALILAADRGHTAIVKLLLEEGADVNANGSYALIDAAEGGWTDIVELLLAVPGIDVNAKENEYDGKTPLIAAAYEGRTAIIELLLARPDIDVNAKDEDGVTPLMAAAVHLARGYGHTAIVELLLDHPDIDVSDEALIEAASGGHTAIVRAIERFIAEQAMNRWIPRHRARLRDRDVGFREFVRSTRVPRRRLDSAGDVEDLGRRFRRVEIDRLPRRAQTFIKGFL